MSDEGTRLVRAAYTAGTVTVYQAYSPQIADAAGELPAERVYPLSPALARRIGADHPPPAHAADGTR